LTVVYNRSTGQPIQFGDLLKDFDFTPAPLSPLVLPLDP
jgi:hypothetical protein